MKMTVLIITLAVGLVLTAQLVWADDPAVPGAGFPASRYEALWTKSPFAVATAEASQDTSPDYMLVGIAGPWNGVSYASVIETKTPQEHFLISTDKATRGLTLTSITRSHDGSDTFAVVQKNGQSITLKLEQASATAAVPGAPPIGSIAMPGGTTQQIPMPGANLPAPGSVRPFIRYHHPLIHLPPPPSGQQQAITPAQPPPPTPQ
jgi:hypothetical protein